MIIKVLNSRVTITNTDAVQYENELFPSVNETAALRCSPMPSTPVIILALAIGL